MRRMNVLVYADSGAAPAALDHALTSLRSLLSPTYAVHTVKARTILDEPWHSQAALVVFPGGGDLQYCRLLNGDGNARIRRYVESGGAYLGLCAGGYYGSRRCEFEVGRRGMEVVGDRELAFFPGICRGGAFSGFEYNSEIGARAAKLKLEYKNNQHAGEAGKSKTFHCYFNGGGIFTDIEDSSKHDIEILASYSEPDKLAVHATKPPAAVICCSVGQGKAILSGPHPEFSGQRISSTAKDIDPEIVRQIREDDQIREDFLRICLERLGLNVNKRNEEIPDLTPLYLSSSDTQVIETIKRELNHVSEEYEKFTYIRCEKDSFRISKSLSSQSTLRLRDITRAILDTMLPSTSQKDSQLSQNATDHNELDEAIKDIVIVDQTDSSQHESPKFDTSLFLSHLNRSSETMTMGDPLLYGEVVTSTSTILERNLKLTSCLPPGTTFTATQQLSGRGRGANVWLSPPGSLMFSTILRHSLKLNNIAPVVFVQYLAAMAVAEGIHNYTPPETDTSETETGSHNEATLLYKSLPVRLKWPNDVYVLDPRRPKDMSIEDPAAYVKIGGTLVNSSYSGGDYTMIVGIGLNVANSQGPTTSLNEVLRACTSSETVNTSSGTVNTSNSNACNDLAHAEHNGPNASTAAPFRLEPLLASILNSFSALYDEFCNHGFSYTLQQLYYSYWMHTDQEVTVDSEPGSPRAIVKGITTDWGLLLAEDIKTGRRIALQSDGNRFDFLHGLIGRKV